MGQIDDLAAAAAKGQIPPGMAPAMPPQMPPMPVMRQMPFAQQVRVGTAPDGRYVLEFVQGAETWSVVLDSELKKGVVKGLTGGIEVAR